MYQNLNQQRVKQRISVKKFNKLDLTYNGLAKKYFIHDLVYRFMFSFSITVRVCTVKNYLYVIVYIVTTQIL